VHFALSFTNTNNTCPVPWFTPAATLDWEAIWPLCQYSEELCEPLACNERDSAPPYVATWNIETPGGNPGPSAILFLRVDGDAHDHSYTFFDSSGVAYETGDTEWMTSPSTIGLRFVANDGSGSISHAAIDVISDEMQFKIDTTMPTDMTGAAIYRYEQ
jgi:hypothetical protein